MGICVQHISALCNGEISYFWAKRLVPSWVQGTGEPRAKCQQPIHGLAWPWAKEGNQCSHLACPMSHTSGTNTAILLLVTAPSTPGQTQVLPDSTAVLLLWVCNSWVMGLRSFLCGNACHALWHVQKTASNLILASWVKVPWLHKTRGSTFIYQSKTIS